MRCAASLVLGRPPVPLDDRREGARGLGVKQASGLEPRPPRQHVNSAVASSKLSAWGNVTLYVTFNVTSHVTTNVTLHVTFTADDRDSKGTGTGTGDIPPQAPVTRNRPTLRVSANRHPPPRDPSRRHLPGDEGSRDRGREPHGHPDLLALIEAGATEPSSSVQRRPLRAGQGFAYAIGAPKRQRIRRPRQPRPCTRGPMATDAPPPGRRTAVDRQIATMNALTGKDRSHGPAPAADHANVVDVDARVVP